MLDTGLCKVSVVWKCMLFGDEFVFSRQILNLECVPPAIKNPEDFMQKIFGDTRRKDQIWPPMSHYNYVDRELIPIKNIDQPKKLRCNTKAKKPVIRKLLAGALASGVCNCGLEKYRNVFVKIHKNFNGQIMQERQNIKEELMYKKPTFFKLGDVATLTKGSGSKALEETSETTICPGNIAHWKKTVYMYKE